MTQNSELKAARIAARLVRLAAKRARTDVRQNGSIKAVLEGQGEAMEQLMPHRLSALSQSASVQDRAARRLAHFASESYDGATAPAAARVIDIGGVAWCVPPPDDADGFAANILSGWLPLAEIARARPYAHGRVMLDIGANIGTTSIPRAILGDFEAVYCAEPEPRNFGALCHTIRTNGLAGVVLADRLAIGDTDGEGQLAVRPRIAGHSMRRPVEPKWESIPVQVRRLDSWVEGLGLDLEDIAFVKVDTQGYDGRVLMGAPKLLARTHIVWQIEYHPRMLIEHGTPHDWMCGFLADHFTHFIELSGRTPAGLSPMPTAELDAGLRWCVDGAGFTELLLMNLSPQASAEPRDGGEGEDPL